MYRHNLLIRGRSDIQQRDRTLLREKTHNPIPESTEEERAVGGVKGCGLLGAPELEFILQLGASVAVD